MQRIADIAHNRISLFYGSNRSDCRIAAARPGHQGHGATLLYVFGSTVRDKERAQDLDLFIDYDPNSKFNAFDLVGIKQYIEDELKFPVDVTTRDGLHPMLRAEIEQTTVRIF